ncbi:hypothetical protein DPMN_192049 [Dreissena polymorpha]|uniref:IRS-type PTB domain-containing protein n=2 Tax=Dreissena polymorpha TaxID=45954 RepID=A0A9D3XZN5_DREPO|nr:hypothetical protein DPMN_192049 [Dreissena polymorpha]
MCRNCAHVHNRFQLLKEDTMTTFTCMRNEVRNKASDVQTIIEKTESCARDKEEVINSNETSDFCIDQVSLFSARNDYSSPNTEPIVQNKWFSTPDCVPNNNQLYSTLAKDRLDAPYVRLRLLSESADMAENQEDNIYFQDEDVSFGHSVDQLKNNRPCGDYRLRKANSYYNKSEMSFHENSRINQDSRKGETLSNIYSDINDVTCISIQESLFDVSVLPRSLATKNKLVGERVIVVAPGKIIFLDKDTKAYRMTFPLEWIRCYGHNGDKLYFDVGKTHVFRKGKIFIQSNPQAIIQIRELIHKHCYTKKT